MWYTVFITLVVDIGGLLLVYALLRDRVRRATSTAAQMAELRDEVSRLVVELNQTTERNVALLEDRIGSLNELLAAADRKMGLLRREIEKHDVGAQVYSRLAEGKRQPPAGPEPATPLSVELSAGAHPAGGSAAGGAADLRQRVVMLSRSGFSPSLIAARVGIPLGEVELIVSLERQRMSQATPRPGEGEA